MKIPPLLESSYQTDHSLASFVSGALSKIQGHISSNRLEFFPEYTDHSVTHIELTLQTAFDLATGPARGLLTSADAVALVVAVGLHDLGMYLTRDGFESLITRGSRWKGVEFFDKKDWNSLWDDFYAEATRFDDRKLRQIFGENYRPVRPIPSPTSPWDDLDYLLVGEFIRRHHPRLAHEIALYGLPAKQGAAIEICPCNSEDHKFLADIAGLVGRSHGMDLRICLDYLEQKYQNKINPRRIHAAFISILLRIADYFQIQSMRAPSDRTDVASFRSQLSEREWMVHQSVKDIHNTSGDPEAIVVIAEPPDVQTFLKLKTWLNGLQHELDQSWAILGEVYGLQSHNNLHLLGMRIRRIKSNIDDVGAFAKTVPYIPARITFEAANADLLKLLVAPLYGNNPGIGLRELIQNSIDAVRECHDLMAQHPEFSGVARFKQDADVKVEVHCDEQDNPIEIIVTDRGVGMSSEIIRDYFLKAGASFRKSSAWRKDHEDQQGHSRVLRTGRFGVGALAAYLLGDEIEVTTRHLFAEPSQGIKFTARLDDEAISLDRISCPVGTPIRIAVPPHFQEAVKRLIPYTSATEISYNDEAGHYFLRNPSLSRHFSSRKDLPVEGWLPQIEDTVSPDWRLFSNSDFEKVFWTFANSYPQLACNGIVITPRETRKKIWEYLNAPNISVFDKDGKLPVNLQRTGLQDELPFKADLLRSIAEDICAYALTEAPELSDMLWFFGQYEGFSARTDNVYHPDWARWLIGRNGFVLNEPNLLTDFEPKTILIALGGEPGYQNWGEIVRRQLPNDVLALSALPHIFSDSNPRIKGVVRRATSWWAAKPLGVKGKVTASYLPKTLVEKTKEMRPGREMQAHLEILEASDEYNGWVRTQSAEPHSPLDEAILGLSPSEENPIVFYTIDVEQIDESKKTAPLKERWIEICDTPLIPFNLERRKALEERAMRKIATVLQVRRQAADHRAKKKEEREREESTE